MDLTTDERRKGKKKNAQKRKEVHLNNVSELHQFQSMVSKELVWSAYILLVVPES